MDFLKFKTKMQEKFSNLIGIEISENQCKLFFDYMNYLLEKNQVMNLTAITDPDEVIMKHFVDSCFLLKFYFINSLKDKLISDVGTGAGFPGIPLAIMCPNSKFVLTDTLGKRINFLFGVLDIIKIKNVQLVKARAEDFGHDKNYREKFNIVLARGVARISVLSEYSLPLIKIGGSMFAYKMDDCEQELNDGTKAIKTLGGMFHVKHSYTLLDSEPKRCIIDIDKIEITPKQYPRKAGTPAKNPL